MSATTPTPPRSRTHHLDCASWRTSNPSYCFPRLPTPPPSYHRPSDPAPPPTNSRHWAGCVTPISPTGATLMPPALPSSTPKGNAPKTSTAPKVSCIEQVRILFVHASAAIREILGSPPQPPESSPGPRSKRPSPASNHDEGRAANFAYDSKLLQTQIIPYLTEFSQ